MGESVKRHEENSNLIKEIQASIDAAIRNQGASVKTLEIQINEQDAAIRNPRDNVKSISSIVEANASSIRVDVVFDGAFGGVGDEEVVVGEGVVVMSSSLDILTNSCLGGIMNEVKENVIDEGIEKSL
ncbi:hypothetical protein Tco_0681123 [Tanacetum coccineum]|uniref:Uncharacterized protein n=1 Tax=Tanacetum coccineum TaxID=301880 RepID=A0ABQ4XMF6_9ASTR